MERTPRRQLSVNWTLLGRKVPRSEIVFLCQVVILYSVILTSIYNLTKGPTEKQNLWISLLCSSLGYLLPNPTLQPGGNRYLEGGTSSTRPALDALNEEERRPA